MPAATSPSMPPPATASSPSRCPTPPTRSTCSSESFRNLGWWETSAGRCSRAWETPSRWTNCAPASTARQQQFRARDQETDAAARKILMLAQSNYEVQFAPGLAPVRARALPGHALAEQRHRGRPLRSLPARGRHADLLRHLHRLRRQDDPAAVHRDARTSCTSNSSRSTGRPCRTKAWRSFREKSTATTPCSAGRTTRTST